MGKICIDKFVIMCYLFVTVKNNNILALSSKLYNLHYILYSEKLSAEYFVIFKNYSLDKISLILFYLKDDFGIMLTE